MQIVRSPKLTFKGLSILPTSDRLGEVTLVQYPKGHSKIGDDDIFFDDRRMATSPEIGALSQMMADGVIPTEAVFRQTVADVLTRQDYTVTDPEVHSQYTDKAEALLPKAIQTNGYSVRSYRTLLNRLTRSNIVEFRVGDQLTGLFDPISQTETPAPQYLGKLIHRAFQRLMKPVKEEVYLRLAPQSICKPKPFSPRLILPKGSPLRMLPVGQSLHPDELDCGEEIDPFTGESYRQDADEDPPPFKESY